MLGFVTLFKEDKVQLIYKLIDRDYVHENSVYLKVLFVVEALTVYFMEGIVFPVIGDI